MNAEGAQEVVDQITKEGGSAAFLRTDACNWDDQVALFELAIAKFGSVDVVVVNAGVYEIGDFETVKIVDNLPVKPELKTIEVNLIASIYTTHLAIHYLQKNRSNDSLKAIVLMGSMASWQKMPNGKIYCAAKHGVLGLGRSLTPFCDSNMIRISIIHPWYSDTAMVPSEVKLMLSGIPLTPVERIAGAVFYSATESDPETNGSTWLIQSDEQVCRLEPEILTTGVYALVNKLSASPRSS